MRNPKYLLFTLLPFLVVAAGRAQTTSPNAAEDLGDTSWQLVKFEGGDGTTLTPDDRSEYTVTFEGDRRVSARVGCNRGVGTWRSSGSNQLQFGPLGLTRAMCPPSSLNDRIPKHWEYVRSYILKDGHLFLSLMADGGIYEFEPISPKGLVAGQLKGTATCRERMALPPNAVFEATLEDVSKADAPAEVIGRARITYDTSLINPSHRYAVRAGILVDGRLYFATGKHYQVLTAGQSAEVALLLRRAGASTPAGRSAETSQVSLLPLVVVPLRRWRISIGR